jgi:hypothetical protein
MFKTRESLGSKKKSTPPNTPKKSSSSILAERIFGLKPGSETEGELTKEKCSSPLTKENLIPP